MHQAGTRSPAPLLVEVGSGELIDKITILEIKAERLAEPARLANVKHELATLQAARYAHLGHGSEELSELESELRKVNLQLWTIEDDLRICGDSRRFRPRVRRSCSGRLHHQRPTGGLEEADKPTHAGENRRREVLRRCRNSTYPEDRLCATDALDHDAGAAAVLTGCFVERLGPSANRADILAGPWRSRLSLVTRMRRRLLLGFLVVRHGHPRSRARWSTPGTNTSCAPRRLNGFGLLGASAERAGVTPGRAAKVHPRQTIRDRHRTAHE